MYHASVQGAARFKKQGLYTESAQPVTDLLIGELAAVIRAQMDRIPPRGEELGETGQHILGFQAAPHPDSQNTRARTRR